MTNNNSFDMVIYHGPSCPDGIGSLYCAKKFLGPDIEIIMCRAGDEPKGKFNGKKILFVDLCPGFEFINKITKIAKKITILDHHKSAVDMYKEYNQILNTIKNLELEIDMEKSGCQITWDYFFPTQPRPWFIDYIADRDLWTWKLPNSKEINLALYDSNYFDFRNLSRFDELLEDIENKKNNLIIRGTIIQDIQKRELDIGVAKAYEAVFKVEGKLYNVWLAGNTSPSLRSELGNMLIEKKFKSGSNPDFAVVWLYEPSVNEWWISLRGNANCPDLSEICKKFGGGGHRNASGFTIKNGESLQDYFTIKNE